MITGSVASTAAAPQMELPAPISTVVRAVDNEALARQAGASTVINPVRFTGLLMAGSAHGTHVADYITDLAFGVAADDVDVLG